MAVYGNVFGDFQRDRRELPSQEDVAKAKLQSKKKPASDNDVI